jgi:Na+-translocating ferredoxin:NAD+ oxidoreductase RnfC subunit
MTSPSANAGNDAAGSARPCVDNPDAALLLRWLQENDVDAAIEAGLMRFADCSCCGIPATTRATILAAQATLAKAWAARDRYRAREARLARRAAQRMAKRAGSAAGAAAMKAASALPPAAAAALARAKARAAGKP